MTHEAHGMSGNVISMFPGAKVHVVFRTKPKKISAEHACRAEFLLPSWESGTGVSMLLCLMVSAWLQAEICMQSCLYPPFIAEVPQVWLSRGSWRRPSLFLPKSDWAGVPLIPPVENSATANKVRSEEKREYPALGPGITFTHIFWSILNNPEFPQHTYWSFGKWWK